MDRPWHSNNTLRESDESFDTVIAKILSQDLSKYKAIGEEKAIKALGLTKCLETTGYYGDVDYMDARMLSYYDLTWARFTLAAKDAGFIRIKTEPRSGYFKGAYRDTSYRWKGKDKDFYLTCDPELKIYWFGCNPWNELFVKCGAYGLGYHGPETVEYDKLMKKLGVIIDENFG